MKSSVGNFVVEVDVTAGGKPTNKVQPVSPAEHRVRVTNRATLKYDVQIASSLPDAKTGLRISFGRRAGNRWNAEWHCLASLATGEECWPLDVHGPAGKERLWTDLVKYRLGHGAIPPSQGGLWVTKTGAPLPLELAIEVD